MAVGDLGEGEEGEADGGAVCSCMHARMSSVERGGHTDCALQDILHGLEGLSMRMFTQILGWSREQVLEHIQEVAADIRSNKMHAYFPM